MGRDGSACGLLVHFLRIPGVWDQGKGGAGGIVGPVKYRLSASWKASCSNQCWLEKVRFQKLLFDDRGLYLAQVIKPYGQFL